MMVKDNKGFSLVELIVSITLLAIILISASSLFTSSFKVQGKSSMKTSVTRVAQYIIENFKNKNYLGLKMELEGNDVELDAYIKSKEISTLEAEVDGLKLTDDGWEVDYEGLKYRVDIKLKTVTKSNISNLDIPGKEACNGAITINSSGIIEADGENLSNYDIEIFNDIGSELDSPNDDSETKRYKVDYPTIILDSDYINPGNDKASIWITNNGYLEENNKQKIIRIIKAFPELLVVYIEGDMISIKEGQYGDGASQEYTKINSRYVGSSYEAGEKSSNELIFDAEMTVTDMRDETIRDTFDFSFPVNY